MSGNGQLGQERQDGQVLHWSARVLSADDLRRSLNGHRELHVGPATIVTPLALDELRRHGVRLSRQTEAVETKQDAQWGYAQEHPQPLVGSVMLALEREGLRFKSLGSSAKDSGTWARAVAECVARGECQAGVVFCSDPGLVCCVANKVKGVRAAAVLNVLQAGRAVTSIGANLLAVEMPGRTFFELRQIVRCLARPSTCPAGVACTLQELENAHR
jgi:ribose 5-phosphate isomerase RpiB